MTYKKLKLTPKNEDEKGYIWLVDSEVGPKYVRGVINYYNANRRTSFNINDLSKYLSLFGIINCSPVTFKDDVVYSDRTVECKY